MPDREKVINGFQKWCDEQGENCPVVCLDVLELLKEQDARVLSLSEALCLKKHDEIWLEYTGCHNKLFMLTVSRVRRYVLMFFNHLPCPWEKYGKAPESETAWSWRVWTAKPTEEQRMAVKWE